MAWPLPDQDEHLPDQIEAFVPHTGPLVQRRLFQVLIEKADQELALRRRHGKGGAGIPRRGTRPFTFKTTFGEVTVERSRIRHERDGPIEVPAAAAWGTPQRLMITRNLRDAAWDRMSDRSAGESRLEIGQGAGDEDLPGRSTVIEIIHQEGEQLVAARRQRARAILDGVPADRLEWLGPPVADAGRDEPCDVPPDDGLGPGPEEWEQTLAEWIATGFPGCEPAAPVGGDEPRDVDPGFVIVEPDEVKTQAQPSSGRKEVWTYTAVVPAAGFRYALAEATAGGSWSQVAAPLVERGVLGGERTP